VNLSALQYVLIALAIALGLVGIVSFEVFRFKDVARARDDALLYRSRMGRIIVIEFSIPIGGTLYPYHGGPR
jgi:hypothetical protein